MKHELQSNGNPTPEACYAVADALDNAIKKHPDMELDMTEGDVQSASHPCGTTHCHAGAYLIGAIEIEKWEYYDYGEGADLMALNLGFDNWRLLAYWAKQNPNIWDNHFGDFMFCDAVAFDDAENVSEIAAWWRAVGDRIKADNLKGSES